MTINNAAANTPGDSRPAIIIITTTTAASRPWRVGAFLLAGAAQLITISALVSVDPLSPTWAALLLAVAPAPLAAAAAGGWPCPRVGGVAMPQVGGRRG